MSSRQSILLLRLAAASLICLAASTSPADEHAGARASSWPASGSGDRVYRLQSLRPSEARRMLLDLLGDTAGQAQIIADDDRSELRVIGSEAQRTLADQLVRQLDQSPSTVPETTVPGATVPETTVPGAAGSLRESAAGAGEPVAGRTLGRSAAAGLSAPRRPFPNSTIAGYSGPEPASDHAVRYRFRHVSTDQVRRALSRLLGDRLADADADRLRFVASGHRHVQLSFDGLSRSCLLEGSGDLVQQFRVLLEHLDRTPQAGPDEKVRFVPLTNVDPGVLRRAIDLWRQSHTARPPGRDGQSARPLRDPFRTAGFMQQIEDPGVSPPESADELPVETLPGETPVDDLRNAAPDELRRPSSDVKVEPLPDLDVLILRGRDPDVEELIRIIQEIERLSEEASPQIEVVYLHNVQSQALQTLIRQVQQDLTGPLQGRISITALVRPNALLLIGWGEAVEAAKTLIARLDESVDPATQLKVFALRHAPAAQLEATIRQFLNGRGGLGPDVRVTSNSRTNSVIVSAAPQDLQDVARLIEELDVSSSAAVNQARIVRLKHALAFDVAQTITQAIQAARGGGAGQRSAALEMLMVRPDGSRIAAAGLLDDVRLTPDARTNRIFITGPAESLPLVEQLIQALDESPAAAAQIKVFQITNGDATDLVQILRSLFPEQVGGSGVPQLTTAAEESSLVPVRFSVDIRTNSIIATGAGADLVIIEALLLRLDETDSQERVNQVYRLKNSPALNVASAVNDFLRNERIVAQAAPGRQNPFAQIESEVVVVPEPVSNALIISATPRYFDQILELVEGLDAQPPQVMIQVILAEVELDNLHEFGVELGLQDSLLFDRSLLGSLLTPGFNFNNQPLGNANTPQSLASRGNVGGQALSHFSLNRTNSDLDFGGLVLSASSENISVLLRALSQTRTLEILSRPQIMTLDNQPAFIQVGQRVPRITGTSINQIGQVNTVELENVGLILGVTPRISPDGMVVMEIDAEKSEVGPEIEGIPVSISADGEVIRSPRVNITTAQTTVSAASGQTIVIGGLITNSSNTISRRVPWLSDVPVVGNLFRFDGNTNRRKELLIILTPHVVRGKSEAEHLKQVETARISWISSDVFNWLNCDPCVVGQLDQAGIPTIFPDQTPGIEMLTPGSRATPEVDAADESLDDTDLNDTDLNDTDLDDGGFDDERQDRGEADDVRGRHGGDHSLIPPRLPKLTAPDEASSSIRQTGAAEPTTADRQPLSRTSRASHVSGSTVTGKKIRLTKTPRGPQ